MYLIVGLGNPGEKYQLNRHNIGFLIVDSLIEKFNASKIKDFKGFTYKQKDKIFLKPLTYMNNSGESVILVKNYFNIDDSNIIVIYDDLDLPFGSVRFKVGGGSGGHNGIKSIDKIAKNYIKIRIGIGRPKNKDIVNYVLSNFSKEELQIIEKDIIPYINLVFDEIFDKDINYIKSCWTKK